MGLVDPKVFVANLGIILTCRANQNIADMYMWRLRYDVVDGISHVVAL